MIQERRPVSVTQSTTSSVSSEVSVSSESHMRRKVELVEDYFEDAKKMVQRALKSDEKGERMSALEMYNQALTTVQAGLKFIKSTQMMNSSLIELRDKMSKLKAQVKTRMSVLLSEEEQAKSQSKATAATVGMSTSSSAGTSVVMGGRGGGKRDSVAAEADVLFTTPAGAKIFRVSSDGVVSNCTAADSISIFRYRNKIPGQPPGFLQCGDFVYPLVPGQSPVLRTSKRAYMFPDVTSDNHGDSVGLMLERLPRDELQELNHVLALMSDMKESGNQFESSNGPSRNEDVVGEPGTEKPTWGSNISGKLESGVTWISGVISSGAEKGGDLLNKGGNKVRENIEPREEPVAVPVPVERGAHYARKASGVVVGVSDFLMTTLAKGTVMVGKKVGSAISESDMVKETEINPHAVEAWKVTKTTVKGAGRVFSDLEKGARAMIRTAGKETSKTAEHKYGGEVGKVTDDSLTTAGHVVDLASTYWNWKTWGISFIAKVGKVISDGDKEASTAQSTSTSTAKVQPPQSSVTSSTSISTVTESPKAKNIRQPTKITKKEKEVEVLYT